MAASFTASMILRLIDKFSGPMSKATGKTRGLLAEAKKLAGLRAGAAAAGSIGRGFSTAGRVGRRALGGLIAIGADFEHTMARVRAKTRGITQQEFTQLERKAIELGEKTQFSGTQVGQGMEFLAQASQSAKEQLVSIEPVLNLAAAGNLKLAKASDIATDVQKEFGLSAGEIGRVADVLTVGSLSATTNIAQLGKGMSKVGPLARLYGISLEEATAFTAAFADVGIKGGIGGRSFRRIIQQLVAPSKNAAKALRGLGVTGDDIEKGPLTVLQRIGEQKDKLGKVEFLGRLTKAFGAFGTAGAAAVAADFAENLGKVDENGESLVNVLKILARGENAVGESARIAREQMDTTRGDILKLDSATKTAAIVFFKELAPSLRAVVQEMTNVVSSVGAWARENPELAKTVLNVVIGATALATVFGPVLVAGSAVVTMLVNMKVAAFLLGGPGGVLGLVAKGLGSLAALGAAAFVGWEIGKRLDELLGISDAIAGVQNQLERIKTRGAPALLGSLTEKERGQLAAAKQRRAQALEERKTGFLGRAGANDQIIDFFTNTDERVHAANAEIERINAAGRAREAAKVGGSIRVEVDDKRTRVTEVRSDNPDVPMVASGGMQFAGAG